MTTYSQRFVQSIYQECLDKFIAFGRERLGLLAGEYVEHYHVERPHQSMGNEPLAPSGAGEPHGDGEIVCRERLGGLLWRYSRVVT